MAKMERAYKVLIADLIGMKFDAQGNPDHSEVKAYIERSGGVFHNGLCEDATALDAGKIHFFYAPDLSREDEILPITDQGQYDGLIAAATFIPQGSIFNEGGVRIGAGTGNMGAASWGGGNGDGGSAPLMNTPSFNSRATAQMAIKALLKVMPDIDVEALHSRVCDGDFDTGKNLCEYPTVKLEGKTMAVIGYGNIGREVANLAKAFGMNVKIYAREHHRKWIDSEGFEYAVSPLEAARNADILSPHTGLGPLDEATKKFANASLVDSEILGVMNDGAVLINYDRGEVVDAAGLDAALSSGKVSYAAIDADLFKNSETCELSGPMVPYLALQKKYPEKLELLPHAAADTEHVSRVEGAKQAVDQIISCIVHKEVTNLKGDLPAGYKNAGSKTVRGVGKVTANRISAALQDEETLTELAATAKELAEHWQGFAANGDGGNKSDLIDVLGEDLVYASNRYIAMIEKLGLKGPYG